MSRWLGMGWLRTRATTVVLVAGLLFSALVTLLLANAERETIDRRFEAAAVRAVAAVEDGVDESVAVLRAGHGFFAASEKVTADEFRLFTETLDLADNNPAIAGYSAVGSVAVNDAEGFTQTVRDLGQDDFTIRPEIAPIPRSRRPIVFIEPIETNRAAIGFDVMANPVAAAATDRALALEGPGMTAPLTLVQEAEDQAAFVIYAPRPDIGPEERLDGAIAFVSAVHRGDDFLAGIFEGSGTNARVTLRDADGGGPQEDGTIGTWTSPRLAGDVGRTTTLRRPVLGRTWEVEVAAVPAAFGRIGPAPWLAGLFGVLATLGTAALQRSVQDREAAARRIADDLTADLRAEEQRVIEANRELATTNDRLAESNEELSRFAFVASHDLQEPLRMVSSFLGLLEGHLEERGELDDEASDYLGYAVDGSRRMSRLIQDLLVLSRVQRRVNEPEPTDTAEVVDGVLAILQGRVEETGASVEVERTDPVVADPTQLLQLVQNLTANALKFTRPGRAPVVRIDAWGDEHGDWHLRVTDNGIGIDPEYRDHVFEAFTRLHGKSEYEGTGIGLAVCQRIARAHNGRIRAEDGIDGGLAVVVDLPGAAVAADPAE